jgi:hypothetical protein
MTFVEVLLAIDVLESFMIGADDELLVGKIVAPILEGLDNSIEFQVISRVLEFCPI